MVIVYADDEPGVQRQVSRALQARGHTVHLLNTGSKARLEADTIRLRNLVRAGLKVDVLVIDGHNLLNDEHGRMLVDMTPLGVLNWLQHNGLNTGCHFILYSNDTEMVRQAQDQSDVKFAATISKLGSQGGLQALLSSIENLQALK
ncbi:MAG TPA: hypothetical protein VH186_21405 [Chloroflexia bacterium]|nr:hypothetical protein [Chloroflexia bacterium]